MLAGTGQDIAYILGGADVTFGDDGNDQLWGDVTVLPGYLTTVAAVEHGSW